MDYPGKVITKNQVTPTQTSATGVWTLDDQAAAIKNNNWPVAGVPNPISKSLRFNSADTAYLNRTPASAGNRKTWTWSGWVKQTLGNASWIFIFGNANSGNTQGFYCEITANSNLNIYDYNSAYVWQLQTTQVFRDPSAWYHFVIAVDTTQATSTNRVKVYVNGSQITAFGTATYPTLNYDSYWNNNIASSIGRSGAYNGNYFNGYQTEINFIDGQALTPSSFGMTDPQTGAWIPIKYSGTYGTNGFYLNFKDATSTTTLGYDYSGNSNNWTTNNFSVTAGTGNDSLTDVPTPWIVYNTTGDVGGVVRGNYCTWNPLMKASQVTLTNGNLDAAHGTFGTNTGVFGGIAVSSGKWYWEETITALSSGAPFIGIMKPEAITQTFTTLYANTTSGYAYRSTGDKRTNSSDSAYGASYTTNDVIGVALDMDAGTLVFYKNGVSQGTAFSSLSGTFVAADANGTSGGTYSSTINFGQRPFAYTPPAGFRSLCTTNLPATSIGFGLTNQADDYFNTVLYTGTSATQNITGLDFQPDWVWIKIRNQAYSHNEYDSVRGANKRLRPNQTGAEATVTDQLMSFNSNGFTLGADSGQEVNSSGNTFVAWNWKAGGTGVSNTAGSITSTVSASTTAGFSIVTYTGNATSGATVGHGLGVAPNLIIVRNRTASAQNWQVYSSVLGATKRLFLDLTDAENTYIGAWNNTAPTSTVFSLGNATDVNGNTNNFVAYCFAAVAGYSAFGSYTGNGSTSNDGPFVFTGFAPRFIMGKRSDSTGGWWMFDTARSTFNLTDDYFYAQSSDAEFTNITTLNIDILSNGFKVRSGSSPSTWVNASGGTYIYMAFAETPFKFSNAR